MMILILTAILMATLAKASQVNYTRGLTDHFISWLNDTAEYEPYGFNKSYIFGASFGGKDSDDTPITKRPVIFVHGTGDMVIGDQWYNNGFRNTIEYFLSKGYTKAELYGSSWGWGDYYHEFQHLNQQEYIMYLRKFINAVMSYTGAKEIDVIAHSMGVTLSRKALKGGWSFVSDLPYFIGFSLQSSVRNFVTIAGANYGVEYCNVEEEFKKLRGCNKYNGYYPGSEPGDPYPSDISSWLAELNRDNSREAQNVYAIYSKHDEIVPYKVFDRLTSVFSSVNQSFEYINPMYNHIKIRDMTVRLQYELVTGLNVTSDSDFVINEGGKVKVDNQQLRGDISGPTSLNDTQLFLI